MNNSFRFLNTIALGAATIGTVFLSGLANAQEQNRPRQFTPSSSWAVDYADKSCILKRDFENGTDKVSLQIHQYGPWIPLTIVISSTTMPKSTSRAPAQVNTANSTDTLFAATIGEVFTQENKDGVVVMPDGKPFPTLKHQVALQSDGAQGTVFKAYLAGQPSSAKNIADNLKPSVIATNVFDDDIELATGAFQAPITALLKCSTELPALWGVDLEATASLQSSARLKKMEGYPQKWVDKGWQGTIDYWIVVDEAGNGLDCIVDPMSSAPREMQLEWCANQPRSGHQPAISRDGKPIKAAGFNFTTMAIR